MAGRIAVVDLSPSVSCGQYPACAVTGEQVLFAATVFREGHDAVGADLVLTRPDGSRLPFLRLEPGAPGSDRWHGQAVLDGPGRWQFRVEGWSDPLGTWWRDARLKIEADVDAELMCQEGALLYRRAAAGVPTAQRKQVLAAAAALGAPDRTPGDRFTQGTDPALVTLLSAHPLRDLLTPSAHLQLWVERPRALYGAWYEFFPRSEGAFLPPEGGPAQSGTFATAALRLPAVAAMGFDVLYLPPVHPIGEVNRKGPNNALTAGPHDPGSPWAIGSPAGGHDAVHPDLGSLADFDAFVARAGELGLEVALDLALQCAPDHPWVGAHPEWFTTRADGTIAHAENPPKKYQDIVPLNFDIDPVGLTAEVLRVVRHWMAHGVRIFRVDNPHTKPLNFWEELIATIQASDPDVLFLAEAFTRPAVMAELGRIGFSQSYTYFTWRTGKDELQEYVQELVGAADFMRPNFFVNTPDILHASLQYGGPAMFKIRALLAALLSPSYGVYAGFELYEHVAVSPGSEEYLDSEKYQLRPRDWSSPGGTLAPYLTTLNQVRRAHPAAHWLRNIIFHPTDSPDVLAWSKRTGSDVLLVVVNLDPHATRETTVHLDLPALGGEWGGQVTVTDQFTGAVYRWGAQAYVRLDPFAEPAHLLVVTP